MSSEYQKPFSDEGRKRFDEIFRQKDKHVPSTECVEKIADALKEARDRDEAAMLEALSGGHPLETKPFVARIKSEEYNAD